MTRPLAIDLYCGLGGWTDGLRAEGYDVIGFDIVRHIYGEHGYPAQLVIQDVRTLHGRQFREGALIVASPPCQKYSWMAMPWKKAKAAAAAIRADESGQMLADLNELFHACFRIQREACEAAGHHIPLIVENVKGAQPWVGRSRWNFGSFYLWGDVPALMPMALKAQKSNTHGSNPPGSWFAIADSKNRGTKVPGLNWSRHGEGEGFNTHADRQLREVEGTNYETGNKNTGGSWFAVAHNTTSGKGQNPDGRKQKGSGPAWWDKALDERRKEATVLMREGTKNGNDWFGSGDNCSLQRRAGSKSTSRRFASAMIAKIPLALSMHIAATFHPRTFSEAAE